MSPGEKTFTAQNDEANEAIDTAGRRRKPLSFYMAFSCLLIMVFLCSADSTIMSVSIPVRHTHLHPLNLKLVSEAN